MRLLLVSAFLALAVSVGAADRLGLEPGDRVVIAGNTLAERAALYGYFEGLLHCAYPEHKLTVRNLGWSGDEVDLMPRPRNFGSFTEHLTWHSADVVFLFFGLNESFAGEPGLPAWEQRLDTFLRGLKSQEFNGETPPKLVLVSPLAHEDLGTPFPSGDEIEQRNAILQKYTNTMAEAAESHGAVFVDLFQESNALLSLDGMPQITINGIHLNEIGYYIVSQMLARSLGLLERPRRGSAKVGATAEKFRRLVFEKNHFDFLTWRPSNPYYVWGGRAWCWEHFEPMRELEQIGALVRDLDQQIWGSEKPGITTFWSHMPAGKELWETPIDHSKYTFPDDPPTMPTVRRNGALAKGQK